VSCSLTPSTRHSVDEHSVWGQYAALSHCAAVDTGIQNHWLFFLEIRPTKGFSLENV